MTGPRVEVFRGRDGQWYFRLRAVNGEITAQSEAYTWRWSAKRAASKLFAGVEMHVLS